MFTEHPQSNSTVNEILQEEMAIVHAENQQESSPYPGGGNVDPILESFGALPDNVVHPTSSMNNN